MGSSEILANWIAVGDRMYQRTELYGSMWSSDLTTAPGPDMLLAAPFGGPILAFRSGISSVHVHRASGTAISHFRWRNAPVVSCGWSHIEDAVFVTEDGTVLIYDIFGSFKSTTSMGQEAKDVRIKDARVFRGGANGTDATGVAVFTTSHRFFLVNNIYSPRIWKMADLPNTFYPIGKFPWTVAAPSARSSKILLGLPAPGDVTDDVDFLTVLSQSDAACPVVDPKKVELGRVLLMALAVDGEHLALYHEGGTLWTGRLRLNGEPTASRLSRANLKDDGIDCVVTDLLWCGNDSVLCICRDTAQCLIASVDGPRETMYLPGYLTAVQEIDGARLLSQFSQEWLQCVPPALHHAFALGGMSPGKTLLLAAEEFDRGSYRANEYVRSLGHSLERAIAECIESASLVTDPVHQKELARAAQFGKAFSSGGNRQNADEFADVCKVLRVLNAIRLFKVGVPMTVAQYRCLTPPVVVDRLLARRLYPLALEICKWLGLPSDRVLAHWAAYKVANHSQDAATAAEAIRAKLGRSKISYCDIAAKAAEHGKNDLAIRLLEYETVVGRQVPLLVTLGQQSQALTRALASGDRNLAYGVITQLRKSLPSTEFHLLVRKFALGKVLYEKYCRIHGDADALQDWYLQEDDFRRQAVVSFEKAVAASRPDTRMAQLVSVQELFRKAGDEAPAQMADEQHRLLKVQATLEEKLPGKSFSGMSLHQTLVALVRCDEPKLAEKVRTDFKVSEKQFSWLKLKAHAEGGQWDEIKKFCVKQKKKPIITQGAIIGLVRRYGGPEKARHFETFLSGDE